MQKSCVRADLGTCGYGDRMLLRAVKKKRVEMKPQLPISQSSSLKRNMQKAGSTKMQTRGLTNQLKTRLTNCCMCN